LNEGREQHQFTTYSSFK